MDADFPVMLVHCYLSYVLIIMEIVVRYLYRVFSFRKHIELNELIAISERVSNLLRIMVQEYLLTDRLVTLYQDQIGWILNIVVFELYHLQ